MSCDSLALHAARRMPYKNPMTIGLLFSLLIVSLVDSQSVAPNTTTRLLDLSKVQSLHSRLNQTESVSVLSNVHNTSPVSLNLQTSASVTLTLPSLEISPLLSTSRQTTSISHQVSTSSSLTSQFVTISSSIERSNSLSVRKITSNRFLLSTFNPTPSSVGAISTSSLPIAPSTIHPTTSSDILSAISSFCCLAESPRVYQTRQSKLVSVTLSSSRTNLQTMLLSDVTISPTTAMETVSIVNTADITLSSTLLVMSKLSPTPTTNITSLLDIMLMTSTMLPTSTGLFSTPKITGMPKPTGSTMQGGLFYIAVGVGVAVVLTTIVFVAVVSIYFCCRSKKYEYSTGNAEYRVTVQRHNPNKEHYTAGSDSAFSSRGSSIRSSFGFSSKSRRQSFTSADHVTAVINLEMYSTPL